jgi:hypothetical protein
MTTIERDGVVCFDVDSTLVEEKFLNKKDIVMDVIEIPHPLRGCELTYRLPLKRNIQLLKDMHTRGRFIVVWSQAGWQWADAVVRALELQNFVDLIIEKPIAYVDDLECQQFMGQRIFLND